LNGPNRRTTGTALTLTIGTLVLIVVGSTPSARAQVQSSTSGGVLIEAPNLGPIPGTLEPSQFGPPGLGVIGGRRRGAGRIAKPGAAAHRAPAAPTLGGPSPLNLPAALPGATPPVVRGEPVALPTGEDDPGPPDGLTLDAAIDRLLAANLDLRALKDEIPQAEADVLTAGLRTNPLLYFDTQFIPYGTFNNARPGGPTQYDVNITYPLDVSHKRQARVRVAGAARRVIEAQYQDTARRQIGNLYRAYVDLQAARLTYLAVGTAVREQERIAEQVKQRVGPGGKRTEDPERLAVQFDKTRSALAEAADTLGDAREALALLLNVPPERTALLEPRGGLRDRSPPPPPLEELVRTALQCRPDLASNRLGVNRADAEVDLARANRLDDVFLFYDPYSYQDNRPSRVPSARSWGIGITVPLPIYNRNQGNIARAHTNQVQSRTELAALERRVVAEVRLAEREYRSSREALALVERNILPNARKAREKATAGFLAGTASTDDYLGQLDDEGETARLYRETLVRHRRSMLDLNTAVGFRVLP
jgi:outer membrane protein, heavy metal efflux system